MESTGIGSGKRCTAGGCGSERQATDGISDDLAAYSHLHLLCSAVSLSPSSASLYSCLLPAPLLRLRSDRTLPIVLNDPLTHPLRSLSLSQFSFFSLTILTRKAQAGALVVILTQTHSLIRQTIHLERRAEKDSGLSINRQREREIVCAKVDESAFSVALFRCPALGLTIAVRCLDVLNLLRQTACRLTAAAGQPVI